MNTEIFSNKVLYTIGIVALAAVLILLFLQAIQVILLIFAGILTAVFLRGISSFISSRTDISPTTALLIVILVFIILITGGVWLLGPSISEGFDKMQDKIPTAWNHLKAELSKSEWGRSINDNVQNLGNKFASDGMITRITGVFSSTLGALVDIFIVLVIGLYCAFNPGLYINGLIKLFPQRKRKRVGEVLEAMNSALKWWFVGRIASMLIIGILTSIGLWIFDIPMPITLGIFAAILTFVPNLGPVISAIPAVLFGLMISPMRGVWIIVLYFGIQTLESYFITPQIQKKAVSLPPALLISTQILVAVLLGAFALILATPLLVCIIVAVQMIYIEDTLGDEVEVLGDGHQSKS